jgi:uncharacterized protein YkwD
MPCLRPVAAPTWVTGLLLAIGITALLGVAHPGAAAGATSSGATSSGATVSATTLTPGWRKEMLVRINEVRAAAGVARLQPCPALRRSAQEYASLMSTRDHFGHVGPDGSSPGERILREGYRWRASAENIAAGQPSVTTVMAAWLDSADHYANLVNPAYRHVGLGHASSDGGEYGDYWVQDFGRGKGC